MLRSVTVLVCGAVGSTVMLMRTPVAADARMLACVPTPLIVIGFVIETVPQAHGSSTEISPPAAVAAIAPANVLHGAVRLHGSASLPTPHTHVRVACANASELPRNAHATKARAVRMQTDFMCPPEDRS